MLKRLVARVWHALRGRTQWRLLWLANATFMVGVTGVVRNADGHVLLLKHRLWPADRQWGLPSGFAVRGEEFGGTVVREVKEETGLDVRVGELIHLRSGFRLRLEVAYEAEFTGGTLRLDPFEILDAGWFPPHALPDTLQPAHRTLIHRQQPPG
ncbi:NUDIX domain-containing protein [Streptomyces sp. JJ66]|uniref:NUDIX domain-containing protein n=1 Tax=Streptomyces sp. JJ66 TaxID=2803843 RepID=UPI001C575543|nr:NUDIX domain-containing protein [Streptomyces sp. JJ66]MBW1603842.1 NUDIX domain-containing protein [Streptomyces sp. JJ66]